MIARDQIHFRHSGRTLRRALAVTAVALSLTTAVGPAVAQDQPNGATIQWAQQILDEKGFYNGRASGRMDAATATAISNYQKSVGLKATGRLDQSTIDKLLADRQAAEPSATVGNLADPNNRARPSAPILKEADVIPQAAPAAKGVEVVGGAPTEPANDRFRGPVSPGADAAPSAGGVTADGQPQPQAAARTAVEVEGGGPAVPEPAWDIRSLTAPSWVRYGLIGLVALIVLGIAAQFMFSGRRATRAKSKARTTARSASRDTVRREPSLGAPAPAGGERRDPYFPSAAAARPDPGAGLRAQGGKLGAGRR